MPRCAESEQARMVLMIVDKVPNDAPIKTVRLQR